MWLCGLGLPFHLKVIHYESGMYYICAKYAWMRSTTSVEFLIKTSFTRKVAISINLS